jgi:hypothetical protein
MSDYPAVQKALAGGADPAMLCATCPWDRNCITPPTMTRAEVEARIADAAAKDEAEQAAAELAGVNPGLPTATLVTLAAYAGRDQSAPCCPVFAMRLRTSTGRKAAELLKDSMQKWDDDK